MVKGALSFVNSPHIGIHHSEDEICRKKTIYSVVYYSSIMNFRQENRGAVFNCQDHLGVGVGVGGVGGERMIDIFAPVDMLSFD